MKVIKIRSVEEAKRLTLPPIPESFFEAGRELQRRAASSNMSRHAVLRARCSPMMDGRCAVYASRPFACRVFAAFDDPSLCAQLDAKHVVYSSDSNAIFAGSKQWLMQLNGSGAVADIRAFFAA